MLDISPDIRTRFNALLVKRAIPEKYHYEYRKWLRYYPDFCRKYHFQESQQESLTNFIKKLLSPLPIWEGGFDGALVFG